MAHSGRFTTFRRAVTRRLEEYNNTNVRLTSDPILLETAEEKLDELGFRRFSFLGAGHSAMAFRTTHNQVVRIAYHDDEFEPGVRVEHPAILQPIKRFIVSSDPSSSDEKLYIDIFPEVETSRKVITEQHISQLNYALHHSGYRVLDLHKPGNVGLIRIYKHPDDVVKRLRPKLTPEQVQKIAEMYDAELTRMGGNPENVDSGFINRTIKDIAGCPPDRTPPDTPEKPDIRKIVNGMGLGRDRADLVAKDVNEAINGKELPVLIDTGILEPNGMQPAPGNEHLKPWLAEDGTWLQKQFHPHTEIIGTIPRKQADRISDTMRGPKPWVERALNGLGWKRPPLLRRASQTDKAINEDGMDKEELATLYERAMERVTTENDQTSFSKILKQERKKMRSEKDQEPPVSR